MRSIEWWPLTHIQGHGITEHEYLKYRSFYGQSFYRTLIGNHTQSIEWYHLSDLWPGFQGHDIFDVKYRKNGAS